MKTTVRKSNRKVYGGRGDTRVVHFVYRDANAESVCLSGTFNDWHPCATPMVAHSPGLWIKDLALAPGDYEYCLIVDGHWRPDPLCEEKVENPFGGMNSVVHIASGPGERNGRPRLVTA
jgi:hypothetical protein